MRLARALPAAAALWTAWGLAGPAAAQLPQGFYVSAGIGANQQQGASADLGGTAGAAFGGGAGTLRLGTMPMGVLAMGYGFGNGIRVELEASLRANTVDGARGFGTAAPLSRVQGESRNYGVMANVFHDFDLGPNAWIQPYLGLGIGYVVSELSNARITGNGGATRLAVDSDDGNLAYQAILGAALPIAAWPGLSATAEYRFMGTLAPQFGARVIDTGSGNVAATGKLETDNTHHSLLVGLRYVFNARPPVEPMIPPPAFGAPPPAAQPLGTHASIARTYIVYFGQANATLDARAREVVAQAAQAARMVGAARIEVAGHTDRAGTPAANQRLSLRRAQAVAAELQRLGIPRGEITVRAAGEAEPLVPTGDGAREPHNRRVEIVLS